MSAIRIFLFTSLLAPITISKCYGQNVDNLLPIIKGDNLVDTTYVLALSELAYQLYSIKSDSSLFLARQADSLATALNYNKGKGRALRVIGIYHWSKGDYPKALTYFIEALDFSIKAQDQRGIAGCYTAMGVIYRNQGNYSKAIEYYFSSIRIQEAIQDKRGLSSTYNNLGLIYHIQKDYGKALEYFNNALQIQTELMDKAGIGKSFLNIGFAYEKMNNPVQAFEHYNRSLKIVEEIGDQRGITFAMDYLGILYLQNQEYDKVASYLERGLAVATEFRLLDRMADLNESYARYYNQINQPLKALQYAEESQKLSRRVGIMEVLENALKQKYVANSSLGRYKEALENFKAYINIRDSISRKEIDKAALSQEYALKEERIRYENDKKELEHLREQERQKRITNTFAGITVTFILISVLVYVSNRKIKKQRGLLQVQGKELAIRNEELIQQGEEILAQRDLLATQNKELDTARSVIENQNREISLRNETLEIEVEKRTRELVEYNQQLEQFAFMSAHNLRAPVARILGLGNLLEMSGSQPEEVKLIGEKIASSTRELDGVVRDINQILQSQRDNTSVMTQVNVTESFQKIRDMLKKEIMETNADIAEELAAVPSIFTINTYFESIFLNLIGNAIKYRDPSRQPFIKIRSEIQGDFLIFSVSDNGLGIDLNLYGDKIFKLYNRFHTHVEGKGIGLYLVKTQLAILQGKIEVESQVKKGTTFKVYFKS